MSEKQAPDKFRREVLVRLTMAEYDLLRQVQARTGEGYGKVFVRLLRQEVARIDHDDGDVSVT